MPKPNFKFFLKLSLGLLCLSLSINCQANQLKFEKIKPGLELTYWKPPSLNTALHVMRVDLRYWSVKPILATDYQKKTLNVLNMQEKSGAVAVINANFFDKEDKALGLVLRDGKVLNKFHPTTWWATLLLNQRQAQIAKIFSPKDLGSWRQGLQAGPRLIVKGKPPQLKSQVSAKSVVGLDAKGRLYLIATEGRAEINQLAKVLSLSIRKGGLGLRQALNLDGGASTQFYFKIGNRSLYRMGLSPVPVGLGVFEK